MPTLGWLPYGSSDASVLFKDPLTSSSGFTANTDATCTVVNASGVHDSVLGYSPQSAGYLKIEMSAADYALLEEQGQISIEVESEWLCRYIDDDVNHWHSDGFQLTSADQVFVGLQPSAGSTNWGLIAKDYTASTATNGAISRAQFGGTEIARVYVHSAGKGRFVKVNFGWEKGKIGGSYYWGVDDLIIGRAEGATYGRGLSNPNWANVFRYFFIGADRTGALNVGNYYCRNFQVSSEPAIFSTHPYLEKVVIVGDSIFNNSDTTNSTPTGDNRDVTSIFSCKRELAKIGMRMGTVSYRAVGGTTVSGIGVTDPISDTIATALADNPTVVFYQGGTNDAINTGTIDSAWNALLEADMTALLAGDSVKLIIVGTIPTVKYATGKNTAEYVARVAAVNAYINALADFDSRIFVADTFTEMGGESPADKTFIGQLEGTDDNLHLDGLGHYHHGRAFFKALMAGIRSIT